MKRIALFFAVLVFCSGCRVRDVRTMTIVSPDIDCERSLRAAVAAMGFLPDSDFVDADGRRTSTFKVLEHDFSTGTIVIRYDAMKVGAKNFEYALSRAGFNTETYPADETMRARRLAAAAQ